MCAQRFERKRALQDGVLIASLLERKPPAVGDMWWVHDDSAYAANPPREQVWYEGTVVKTGRNEFVVNILHPERLPKEGCSVPLTTTVDAATTTDPDVLVRQATESLYCIDFEFVTQDLLVRSPRDSPKDRTPNLARKGVPGEIDWFISHSWNDDPYEKWKVLKAEAESFRKERGRWPVLWLDKVCLDQNNIVQSLKCLPIYLLACKGMLVLGGETYISRLWCIWELYTLFAISDGKHTPNVVIREFQQSTHGEGPAEDSALKMVQEAARTKSTNDQKKKKRRRRSTDSITDMSDMLAAIAKPRLPLREQIERFDLKAHTKCYDPNEEANLMSTIRAAPGGEEAFNETVRGLAVFMQDTSSSRKLSRVRQFGSLFGVIQGIKGSSEV